VDEKDPTQTHGHNKAIMERQLPAKARQMPHDCNALERRDGPDFSILEER
jgi:hypothetical protein